MALHLLSRLWSNAREALTRLRSSLVPLDVLDRKERRDLGRWIAALETFVRRIVLLEALSLDREPSRPHSRYQANASLKGRRPRGPRLRLWPRAKTTGPRIRPLGPPVLIPEVWREQHRRALIARLAAARGRRRKPHIILADRIDALESILAAPMRAARRLARKLAQIPRLALRLAMVRPRAGRGIDDALHHELQDAVFQPAFALNSS
jgi:hypothetical protein